uniref:Uncharacterized protein n=1 Tax=Rhizophagus irregularis (strain DAOM 181602 / DAOM 197198 / MUCL 43194) TaxID=747089 RepID=U9U8W9_RHIID
MKNMIKLRGKVEDFWDDEERLPKEGCTHVIVDSLLLSINRELAKMNQINQDIIDQLNRLAIRGTDELDVHDRLLSSDIINSVNNYTSDICASIRTHQRYLHIGNVLGVRIHVKSLFSVNSKDSRGSFPTSTDPWN